MFKKLVLWSMVLIAATLIFYFSAEQGSVSQVRTYKMTELVSREGKKLADMDFVKLHYYIRKGAHFFEYLMLAFLMSLAIKNSKRGAIKQSIGIFLLCIIFACIDEWIQTFTAGRSGRIEDVLIDGAGVLMGTVIYCVIFMVFEKFRYLLLFVINHYIKKEI